MKQNRRWMNRFLGIFSLFFMFLCCEPYVFLKGNIKNLLKYCFLQQGVWAYV